MQLIGIFKAFINYFYPVHAKTETRPNSLEHSPLKKLPAELIVSIAEFLPSLAAASFTLTCRPVLHILGNRYLKRLKKKRRKRRRRRLAFLELLERDLPYHILCYDCRLFHRATKQRYNSRWSRKKQAKCVLRDFDSEVDDNIYEKFCSVTFLSAMKLHRNGLDCSGHLSLLTQSKSGRDDGHNYRWEATPRIVNGHFILRHQTWLLFPVGYDIIVPDLIPTDVCPHWSFDRFRLFELEKKLKCRVSHWDNLWLNSRCPKCSGLFQCKHCHTEFQIDTKDFFENGIALILSRWLDLGEGRTLSDPRYASHVCHSDDDTPYIDVCAEFEAGSIRDAYEGGNFDAEKLLTPKDTHFLFTAKPYSW